MTATDDLFQLIHSLSKSEKRDFKLFASKYHSKGTLNFIRLFDEIEKQKEYNEAKIKEALANTVSSRNFPALKNFLYNYILDSIESSNDGLSSAHIARRLINKIEFLYSKRLPDQVQKMIKKAKKIATLSYNMLLELEILEWEMKVNTADVVLLKRNYEERTELLRKYSNLTEYHNLLKQVYSLYITKGMARSDSHRQQLNKIIHSPLLTNERKALTLEAMMVYHNIHSLYCISIKNFTGRLKHNKRMIELFEQNPGFIKEFPLSYINVINNVITVFFDLKNYPDVFAYMKKLDQLPVKGIGLIMKKFVVQSISGFRAFAESGNFDKAVVNVTNCEKQMDHYSGKMFQLDELTLYFLFSYSFYGTGNYKKALYYVNKILNTSSYQKYDIYYYYRIYSLIVHYELGNNDFLEHYTVSTNNYLKRKKHLYAFEKTLLTTVTGAIKTNSKKELDVLFSDLQEKLLQFSKNHEERIMLDRFDFISWIESKIEKKSFAEVVKRKAGKISQ